MERLGPRSGGVLSGLLVAGLVVFLLMIVGGIVVMKTVRIRNTDGPGGADVAIDTPAGRLNIHARDHASPALAGVPVYPGADRTDDSGGASFEWNSSDGASDKNLSVVGAEFRTKDPVSRVVEFYRNQIPNLMIVSETGRSTRLEYRDGGIRRIISVYERDGATRIGVAAIGGRESN